jgi:5-hydroxyisourate hydrolase-like protein (transthyretin family)
VFVGCNASSAGLYKGDYLSHNGCFMNISTLSQFRDFTTFQSSTNTYTINDYTELQDVFNKINNNSLVERSIDIYLNRTNFKFYASIDDPNSILSLNKDVTVNLHPKSGSSTKIFNSSVCFIVSNGTLNIDNLSFNNSGIGGGDMMRVNGSGALNIRDSFFINNKVTGGDMIKVKDKGVLDIRDSHFHHNVLTSGGCISLNSKGSSVSGCDIIGTTTPLGAVYIDGGCSGNKINYNRFSNFGGGKDCYDNGGSDLNYNWWGVNQPLVGDSGQIRLTPGSNFNNRFLVSLSANTSNNKFNRTYSDRINFDYQGTSIPVTLSYNLILNTTGTNANRLPFFAVNNNGNIMDGRMPYSFDVVIDSPYDFYRLNSVLDNENMALKVAGSDAIEKPSTILKLDNVSGDKGCVVQLRAILTDSANVSLKDKLITFTVNGKEIGSNITNNDGMAVFNYNVTEIGGEYQIKSVFNGDNDYNPSKSSGILKVNPTPTILTMNPVNGLIDSVVDLTACLNDNVSNIPIGGKSIDFVVDGVNVGSNITNDDGVAVYHYRITESKGDHLINGIFKGDYEYNASRANSTLRVNRFDSQINVNSSDVVSVGDKLSGVVRLLNKSSGLGIVGADLNVSLKALKDGLDYSKVLSTNSDGGIDLSDLDYNFTKDGKYNLSVTYNGDNYYESSNISKMLVVHPLPVPFNGTFHPFGDGNGYYNVLLDNSRGYVLDDSVVLYNMGEALNGWIIDGIGCRNAKAEIDGNILTINWNVSEGYYGYVDIFVKKVK